MSRNYAIYDVFCAEKLAGNPLAVVFDADGLDGGAMQAIAREFNLAETVFVSTAKNPAHTAALRIFTPVTELPFAGHPTVGAAIALAERGHPGQSIDLMYVLDETVGPVRAAIRLMEGQVTFGEFDVPRKAERTAIKLDRQQVADALSIHETDIGFENHEISAWSAGTPFVFIPVHGLAIMQQLDFQHLIWRRVMAEIGFPPLFAYVYCRDGVHHDADFHARMFGTDQGIAEDPATGAAVSAMSGLIHEADQLSDGHHALLIEQGVEMGRPSLIHLHLDISDRKITKARIGGQAVRLATGLLEL